MSWTFTRTSGAQDVLELLRLICLFEIIEEKDKNTLTYTEPVPWPSLMEISIGSRILLHGLSSLSLGLR